jgi:DNA-directed RNA polymerase III subunit RPC5
VAAAVRLPPQDVLEIIRTVAKYNPSTGWELLIPPDVAFENKYPDVIQRQNLYWEARQRQFNEMLIGENVPKRQRKKSQRESVSSDTMMSPKPRCNSVSEEDSERKRHKNKSATGSGKRTRNISSSSVQDAT